MAVDMSLTQATSLILFLIAALFLSGILTQVIGAATAQTEREACALTVTTRLLGEQATGGWINPFEINCARRVIFLEEENAFIYAADLASEVSGQEPYRHRVATYEQVAGERTKVPAPRTPNATARSVEEVLAYEMGLCWELFQEGRGDIIDSDSWFEEHSACVVCAEVRAPQELESETINIEEYLAQTDHPFYHSLNTPTYHDYLRTNSSPSRAASCQGEQGAFSSEKLALVPGESYAVVFVRSGSGVDWVRGQSCQAVDVVATRNLHTRCDAVVN